MNILDFPGQSPVMTENQQIINTLVRKGWTIRPPQPDFDPTTHAVRWDGSAWVTEPLPPPAPLQVTPLQARIVLAQMGMLDQIEDTVAQLPTTDPVRLAWLHASVFDEASPALQTMCEVLEITPEQRRALFLAASQVVV